jgi:hypothetical protein
VNLKPVRQKKVLGIAMGERSLLAAEVVAGDDRPQAVRLAEMVYPEGISLFQPAELAKAVAHFLKDNHFASRSAVIGIPLKWLVAKPKEVPPADDATVAQLLRLEAEAEFSTELKDLVYDFAGDPAAGGASRTVLLAATPRKYIDAIEALCDGARLAPLAITPSAMALGAMTGSSLHDEVLVLAVGATGSELSSQRQSSATAIHGLRSSAFQPPFISELRRAVSTLPVSSGRREMILWDDNILDAATLGEQIGVKVRVGKLGEFGIDAGAAGVNGQSAQYAAAVSLALSAMGENGPSIDFLHSRLAPPRQHRIPRWAYLVAGAVILLIVLAISAYSDLSAQEQLVADKNNDIAKQQKQVDAARDFVSKETLAAYWRGGDPRYMACIRDLDAVIPEDGQTYATSLEIKAPPPSLSSQGNQPGVLPAPSAGDTNILSVTLQGHTANLESVTALVDRMNRNPSVFKDPKTGPETKVPRTQEFLFSIAFGYVPPKAATAAAQPPK